ncbi:MAG: hypothetical protein PHQ84_02930 [Candidatus Omnitrophica bacterium]|jgi:hypothetical protein|nr:hypothetical protein [Candidatus Omnitrophota bacterium]MDD3274767.1 hypothetical protein [Candidatus Omnitrophota bacterium]MDD5077937.1 hypothetical protein [Candidatus Omnitrophota bacterium]MDD5724988.1 hypothetical protein [Candidatus Omnitrophota bacterium]
MKKSSFSIFLMGVLCILSGCATMKEAGKGFLGVSTRILEDGRKDALKKSFALDYHSCYLKVKDILAEKGKESYIYSEDADKKLIAFYLSCEDTTPVGIFFTEETQGGTLIEISSPSTYAKEEIAKRVFPGLELLVKNSNKEKKDVKEKSGN